MECLAAAARLGFRWRVLELALCALLAWGDPSPGSAGDLKDFVSDLYGGDGIQVITRGPLKIRIDSFPSESAFQDLGDDLASGVNFFSLNSAVSGFEFDLESGKSLRTVESLGPLIAERADTLGESKLNVNLTYTRLDFKRFEGDRLSDLSLTFENDEFFDTLPGRLNFELDTIEVDLDVELEQDVYALMARYGFSDSLDIGVVVPFIHVSAKAKATATYHPCTVEQPGCISPTAGVFVFDEANAENSSTRGSARGLGDILLRAKWNFLREQERWPDLALLGQVKLATGDEDDLLGTGETNFMLMGVASRQYGRFSPHLNLGYEMTTGSSELDNLRYVVGVETRLHPRLTLMLDTVGRWEPSGDGIGDHLLDLAPGFKLEVWRGLIFGANFMFPLNRSEGLRTDVTWTVGFEYTFGLE